MRFRKGGARTFESENGYVRTEGEGGEKLEMGVLLYERFPVQILRDRGCSDVSMELRKFVVVLFA